MSVTEREIKLDAMELSKELQNSDFCQLALRGSEEEIKKLLSSEGVQARANTLADGITEVHLYADDLILAHMNVLQLLKKYPLLKACGFAEYFPLGRVYVFYSESGCAGISEFREAGWFEPRADAGPGRWPETENVCEPIKTKYVSLQTGDSIHVEYSFPFASKWNRFNYAVERNGKLYIDAERENDTYRDGAFVPVSDLRDADFVIEDGVLTKYVGSDEEVEIPPISMIGHSAFSGNKTVRRIHIPDGCVEIEQSAFAYCENLESVELPDTIRKIGAFSFEWTKVKKLHISAALETIEFDPVGGLSVFDEITISSLNTRFKYVDGVLLDNEGTTAYFCDKAMQGTYRMPDTVTRMHPHLFDNIKGLEEVTLSQQLKVVPYRTFYNCTGLRKVILPQELTMIDSEAFAFCERLQELHVPATVNEIGTNAFQRASGRICLEGAATKISKSAFSQSTAVLFAPNMSLKEIPSDLKQPAVFGLAAVKADGMEISEERLKEYAAYLKRQRKNYWVEYGVKNRPEVAALMADFGLL